MDMALLNNKETMNYFYCQTILIKKEFFFYQNIQSSFSTHNSSYKMIRWTNNKYKHLELKIVIKIVKSVKLLPLD